jgi:hypothetical protein
LSAAADPFVVIAGVDRLLDDVDGAELGRGASPENDTSVECTKASGTGVRTS